MPSEIAQTTPGSWNLQLANPHPRPLFTKSASRPHRKLARRCPLIRLVRICYRAGANSARRLNPLLAEQARIRLSTGCRDIRLKPGVRLLQSFRKGLAPKRDMGSREGISADYGAETGSRTMQPGANWCPFKERFQWDESPRGGAMVVDKEPNGATRVGFLCERCVS